MALFIMDHSTGQVSISQMEKLKLRPAHLPSYRIPGVEETDCQPRAFCSKARVPVSGPGHHPGRTGTLLLPPASCGPGSWLVDLPCASLLNNCLLCTCLVQCCWSWTLESAGWQGK